MVRIPQVGEELKRDDFYAHCYECATAFFYNLDDVHMEDWEYVVCPVCGSSKDHSKHNTVYSEC